jgi:hypothetical protein
MTLSATATPARTGASIVAWPGNVRGAEGDETLEREGVEHRARDSAESSEDHALGHELSEHLGAAGAHRPTHRELRFPRREARDQQVRHVDARDEENQPDRAQKHDQRGPGRPR